MTKKRIYENNVQDTNDLNHHSCHTDKNATITLTKNSQRNIKRIEDRENRLQYRLAIKNERQAPFRVYSPHHKYTNKF